MDDETRGKAAWHMQLVDVRIGHEVLGFDYPMNGDRRPGRPAQPNRSEG